VDAANKTEHAAPIENILQPNQAVEVEPPSVRRSNRKPASEAAPAKERANKRQGNKTKPPEPSTRSDVDAANKTDSSRRPY
jgi:hypothetical protein